MRFTITSIPLCSSSCVSRTRIQERFFWGTQYNHLVAKCHFSNLLWWLRLTCLWTSLHHNIKAEMRGFWCPVMRLFYRYRYRFKHKSQLRRHFEPMSWNDVVSADCVMSINTICLRRPMLYLVKWKINCQTDLGSECSCCELSVL